MKKVLSLLVIACLICSAPLFALDSNPTMGLSVYNSNSIGALSMGLGGATGLGAIGLYSDVFDAELGLSHVTADSGGMDAGRVTSVSLAIALKNMLAANTYLTYGLQVAMLMGSMGETDIKSATVYGFFLGLQAELTANLLLSAKWFPLISSSFEVEGPPVLKTTGLGNSADIGITYLVK